MSKFSDFIKMDERGQVVFTKNIRRDANLKGDDKFAVFVDDNKKLTVIKITEENIKKLL